VISRFFLLAPSRYTMLGRTESLCGVRHGVGVAPTLRCVLAFALNRDLLRAETSLSCANDCCNFPAFVDGVIG